MRFLRFWQCVTALVLCLAILSACAPSTQTGVTTTGGSADTTTTSADVTTTTLPTTMVTQTAKTTVTTSTGVSTIPTTTVSRTAATHNNRKASTVLTFDYESDDYEILRQAISREFPEEKNLEQFVVSKYRCEEQAVVFPGRAFCVYFRLKINEVSTEAYYKMYFTSDGRFLEYEYRNPIYDPSSVKPPRVPTDAEIEQAKKEAAAQIDDSDIVWEQTTSVHYDIGRDWLYLMVETVYASRSAVEQMGYLDETSPNYGKTPPHAMKQYRYTIPR